MKIKIVFLILVLSGCNDNRQIIKEIIINNIGQKSQPIILCWYRESYLSGTRAFISIKQDGDAEKNVLTCNDINITNIDLKNDTILIKLWELNNAGIYSKQTKEGSFIVILKEASYLEWFEHYHPGEKFHPLRVKKRTL